VCKKMVDDMHFNVDKCEVLQISLKTQSDTCYILNSSKLKQVTDTKYLGAIIDSKLSFNKHIDMTCKKVNSTLSFLWRNLYHCQWKVKIDAYHTYVRPILEYAVTALAPYTQWNINKLEGIQCWAARFVMSDFSTYSSVSTMLSNLKWETLHCRRYTLNLIMFFKILNNLVELLLPNYINPNISITRGHKSKFSILYIRIDTYKYSFFPATVPIWNNLPDEAVRSKSIDTFINFL